MKVRLFAVSLLGTFMALLILTSPLGISSIAANEPHPPFLREPTPGDFTSISSGSASSSTDPTLLSQYPDWGKPNAPVNIGPAAMPPPSNMELVGQIGGATKGLAIRGNYAYVGIGPRLAIIDVSNPTNPIMIGQSPPMPGIVSKVVLQGEYAYVADWQGDLRIIDVNNPHNLREVGSVNSTPGDFHTGFASGVAVSGSYAYLGYVADNWYDSFTGLRIVDISNPVSPTDVSYIGSSDFYYLVVVGNFAYVAGWGGGFRVFDISNPISPTLVSTSSTGGGGAAGVAVLGNYAYIAASWQGLLVMDISNPLSPTMIGHYTSTLKIARDVYVSGNCAFVADKQTGLHILDVSNPFSITEVGSIDTPGTALGVTVENGYAYIADYDKGVRVIDVSASSIPFEVGAYEPIGYALAITVTDNHAYIADANDGLRIVDVSIPTNLVEVGRYDTPGYTYDVVVKGDYTYVADGLGGLRIVSIKNPLGPTEVGFYGTAGVAQGIAFDGNYAYVADGAGGLRIIDISNPSSPWEVGACIWPDNNAIGLAYSAGYVFLLDFYNTSLYFPAGALRIIDVSNPFTPTMVGSYAGSYYPGIPGAVAVEGNYAYLGTTGGGFYILDVSNPVTPTQVGHLAVVSLNGIAVAGDFAFLASSARGVGVVNISNLITPTLAGFYFTPGHAAKVAVSGGCVYVADEDGGVSILRYTDPSAVPTPLPTPTSPTLPYKSFLPIGTRNFTGGW